ncbi:CG16854, partial [Drosophila busckii]
SKYLLDPKYMTKRDLQHYYRYYNLTKNRGQFKKIVVIIFCVCVFSYLFVDYNLRTKLLHLRDRFDFIARIDVEYNMTPAYFVDTPGCRMPFFEVLDDNIAQFMFKPKPYVCNKPLTRTSDVIPGQLELNMNASEMLSAYNISDLASVMCNYTELQRVTDRHNEHLPPVSFRLAPRVQLPQHLEFLMLECYDAAGNVFYKDCHFFAVDKPQSAPKSAAGKKSYKPVSFNNSHENDGTPERLSIMVLGIDSVSHLNFQRQMRNTASYIKQHLSHVEFWGYNKVGDNTFPNLVPLLSGLDDQELNISCVAPLARPSYDLCSFIWKRYKQAGYKTVYAEDVGVLGLFNFYRKGFRQAPTDYYLRPLLLEMEQHIAYKKEVNVKLCMGGRRTADVLLEYMRKLLPRMQRELFFSFFWTVTLTHDYLNSPMLLDAQLLRNLQQLQTSGVLNRTLVLLMSDHGMRWGSFRKTYQGMMEERQPLLIALYPDWLQKRYPLAIANLQTNAKRLTTPFDLHATLLHLLDMQQLEADNLQRVAAELQDTDGTMPRGISLFLPVPVERNCEQAGIAAHWCTCHQRQELATNDARVQRAARYLVRLINERLSSHPQCRTLYLNSILQAFIAAPHHKIVKELSTDYAVDITLRLQTKPGLGVFESTVRMSSYANALTGTISRINLYGSQSYCINDTTLKMFCYCHR